MSSIVVRAASSDLRTELSPRQLSVALTVASLDPKFGGPSRSVPALRDALIAAGASARILARPADRTFRLDLRADLASRDVQVLHDNGVWLPTNHQAVAEARARSIPVILSPRGMLTPWALRHRAWKKKVAWWAYQRSDLRAISVLHATSGFEADELRTLGLRQPVAIIPNGVDVPELRHRPPEGGKRTALFLSRVHPGKGLLNLVRAWAAVRPDGWRMLVVGPDEGGHKAEVLAAVRRAGLESAFQFRSPVDGEEKLRLFQTSHLFVLPTHSENFGIVVAEALANGLPVLTTKGAPWASLEPQRCGWWVDSDASAIAAALTRAVALTDAERADMGLRGRAYVRHQFAWSAIGHEMLAVYSWMVGTGVAPACVRRD